MYITMNGIKWIRQDNWLNSSDICEFYGVECIFIDMLVEFSFSDNNLIGSIPTQIQFPQTMRDFGLSSNSGIAGPIPTKFGALLSLDSISLHDCDLTGPIPSELGLFTHLDAMELSGNRLSGTILHELFKLSRLKGLELQENELTGTLPVPSVIGEPPRLNLINLI
jgi:Leucine-rich repeat (LRR) protein